MTTIPTPGSELRHVRKTLTFDGSANNGLLGSNVPVFTTTGRVRIAHMDVYCATTLVADPDFTALKLRTAAQGEGYYWYTYAYGEAGNWLFRSDTASLNVVWAAAGSDIVTSNPRDVFAVDGNIFLEVLDEGGALDLTAGSIIIDVWYRPITDDGALAGDDIDSGALSAIQSDLDDIQTRLPAALVGGRMDASVGAMAAAVITAAAMATDAIDADALAADAVTEIWAKAMSELASVPAVNGTVLQALEWIFLLARNKLTQTATTQTLRNDADNATIGQSTIADDGTTFTRNEWS